ELPPELVAQGPPADRSAGRLLVLDAAQEQLSDRQVRDLPELLRPGDLLVFNDTRVLPARLFGRKDSGGEIEVLIERVLGPNEARVQARASKPLRPGREIAFADGVRAEVVAREGELYPYAGETRIFILPGYRIRSVDALVTNFHLPESTLLMLVSAFAGRERVLAAYRHAVARRYRFFSYGDAMLFFPPREEQA